MNITNLQKNGSVVMLQVCWSMRCNKMQECQPVLFVQTHIDDTLCGGLNPNTKDVIGRSSRLLVAVGSFRLELDCEV